MPGTSSTRWASLVTNHVHHVHLGYLGSHMQHLPTVGITQWRC
jgi:hypothetical protein